MDESHVTRLWADISAHVGDDLRVVTRYDASSFESRIREDLRATYDDADNRSIVDDTIVAQLHGADAQDILQAGRLRAFVRVFDNAWILTWPDELPGKSGVIVSIERGSAASMDDVEWCIQYLDELHGDDD